MSGNLIPILGFLGVAVTALATYVATARKMSGNVESSDADVLWAQSTRMYDAQAKRLESLEKRVESLERDKVGLIDANLTLREGNLLLERELAQMKERCEGIVRENEHLKTIIKERLGGM